MDDKKLSVLLATHIAPALHGQAATASLLVDEASKWKGIDLYCLNTVYASERSKLGGFSILKVAKLAAYMWKAARMIHRHQIGCVILCPSFFKGSFIKDALFAWFIKKSCGVELVAWVHMDPARLELDHQSAWFRLVAQKSFAVYSHWVACAPSLPSCWPSWLTERVEVSAIANGVADLTVGNRDRLRDARCRVVYLSAMDDEKGWTDLWDVARELCQESEDYRFDFYGGAGAGFSNEDLKGIFARSGFPDRICWHGAVWGAAKHEVLSGATLLVFPSYTEQFPITVLEAMAYGLPVIATNTGGICDALNSECLIDVGDQESLKNKLRRLWRDREWRSKESEVNRQRYKEEFSGSAFGDRWREFLSKAFKVNESNNTIDE